MIAWVSPGLNWIYNKIDNIYLLARLKYQVYTILLLIYTECNNIKLIKWNISLSLTIRRIIKWIMVHAFNFKINKLSLCINNKY